MPIEVFCQSCQKKLRVPDTAAGKRIKCPKCQGVLNVPMADAPAGPGNLSGAIPTPSKVASKSSASIAVPTPTPKSGLGKAAMKPKEQWFVQTEDGQQYGPVSRTELDQWYADGRITTDTQILLEGGEQWQWASDLYPDLAPEQPAPGGAVAGGIPDFGAIAASGGGGSSGPFDFGAAKSGPVATTTSSVTSRGKKGSKKGKRGGGSPQIDYLAYACYAMGGFGALMGLLFIVAGASMAAMIAGSDPDNGAAAGGVIGGFTTVLAIVIILLSSIWFAAGYGLQQRAGWGRILTLVLGAINLLSFPVGTALGVWAFMVLLDKDNAAVFK